MRVVDAHVHIYSTEERCRQLRWLRPDHMLAMPHTYTDYKHSESPASDLVFIECDTVVSPDFHEVLEEIQDASCNEAVKSIVSWTPMTNVKILKEFMHLLLTKDTRGLIHGVRMLLQDKPDGLCRSEDFIKCAKHLGTLDMSFAIGIDVHRRGTVQLEDALFLIESCPGTTFVIDHLAKPKLSVPLDPTYVRLMRAIATHPKVYMKLSGCLTELEPDASLLDDGVLSSYIKFNLDVFTAHRLIFGSDWPILEMSQAAHDVAKTPQGWFAYCYNLLRLLGVSEEDLGNIFARNAQKVYHIS